MSYGTESWGGIVANPFELCGLKDSTFDDNGGYVEGENDYPNVIDIGFQLTIAVISTAIISGALAIRVKFGTWMIFSGIWATLVYFPLAHMVWGGGILDDGENSIASWIFDSEDGEALITPIAFAADVLAGLAWINTTAATTAAILGWLLMEKIRDGYSTSLGAAPGVVAGLVTINPAGTPVTSLIMGLFGGMLGSVGVRLKFRFGFYDSLDVVGVHLVARLWGTIAIAFFANDRGILTGGGADGWKLLVVQFIIAAVAVIFAAIITAIIAVILKSTIGWRVTDQIEADGIDFGGHRETGYDIGGRAICRTTSRN